MNKKGVNDVMINITLTPFLPDSDIIKNKIFLKAKKFDHLFKLEFKNFGKNFFFLLKHNNNKKFSLGIDDQKLILKFN
jgi:hypothetical protein